MVEADRGIWGFLLTTRTGSKQRAFALAIGVTFLLLSFSLVLISGIAHFFGISFVSIVVFAWLGGFRSGLFAGAGIPLLAIPVGLLMRVPLMVLAVDVATFAFMAILSGAAIGVISSLFGQVVSSQKELSLLYQILPICSHCHNIRQDDQEWVRLETFFDNYAGTQFSHGICPSCLQEHFSEFM